jgi:hypothetical protein
MTVMLHHAIRSARLADTRLTFTLAMSSILSSCRSNKPPSSPRAASRSATCALVAKKMH